MDYINFSKSLDKDILYLHITFFTCKKYRIGVFSNLVRTTTKLLGINFIDKKNPPSLTMNKKNVNS